MNITGLNFNYPNAMSIGITQPESVRSSAPVAKEAASSIPQEDKSDISMKGAPKEERTKKNAAASESVPDLVVMRDKGLDQLVGMIDNAEKSIDVHIYMLMSDNEKLKDSFVNALNRGVKVRLMVEDDPLYWTRTGSNPSQATVDEFVALGAEYKPDHPKFSKSSCTHEKSMIFDGEKALILTGNLKNSTFSKNLDIGAIVIENPKVVSQIQTIFDSDWDRVDLPDLGETNLVISPDNARPQLMNLIDSAETSIKILQQGFTDKAVIELLAKKAGEGIKTEITLTDPGQVQGNMQSAAYLMTKGADVNFMVRPYIHAKGVDIDTGTPQSRTYIGSQNFSTAAIDRNRELGYIFHDSKNQLDGIIEKYSPKAFEVPSAMVLTDTALIGTAAKSAIRTAEKEVLVQTNLFSDSTVKSALKQAAKRGIDVSVVMPENPFPWDPNYKMNIETAEELKAAGINVVMTDPTEKPMQGTCFVVDGKESISFPDSISSSGLKYNNSYGVLNISPKDVSDTKKIIEAQLASKEITDLSPTSNVVASPANARQKLETLIKSAETSLKITTKELNDKNMVELLQSKAKEGVEVNLLLARRKSTKKERDMISQLEASGVKVRQMSFGNLNNNYIEVDRREAYVGSHSLSDDSLDKTQGTGNIISHPEMLRIARGKFSEHCLLADMQSAKDSVKFITSTVDGNSMLQDLLMTTCKRGVKLELTSNNYKDSIVEANFTAFNSQLEKMAKMPADTDEAKTEISRYFGEFFDVEKGLEIQKHVAKVFESFKPGEQMLTGISSETPVKGSKAIVDGREIELLPTRADEIAAELTSDPTYDGGDSDIEPPEPDM